MQFIPLPTKSATLGFVQEMFPFLDIEKGPWIAGGAARKIYQGVDFGWSDIDVFFPSADTLFSAKLFLESRGYVEIIEQPKLGCAHEHKSDIVNMLRAAFTTTEFEMNAKFDPAIQLLGKRFFPSLVELFDDFDFTICMFATDGKSIVCDDRALDDLASKTLSIPNSAKNPKKPKPGRLAKYCEQGFTPGPGVIRTMLAVDQPSFLVTNDLTSDEY